MPLRELLDELLTSLETGPLITATATSSPARRLRAVSRRRSIRASSRRSEAAASQQLYSHQARAFEIGGQGRATWSS